ncbi:MAG: hypothetical protein RIC55_34365 [Pirellulaceae bacterium]
MLDRLENATRRWEGIRPDDTEHAPSFQAATLSVWIDRDVCPVLDELVKRPDFRGLARWSLDNLSAGQTTEPRRLVEAIEAGIVATAGNRLRILKQPPVREAVAALAGRQDSTASPGENATCAASDQMESTLEFIASRPWRDLVSEYDYFGPAVDLNLVDRAQWFGPDSRDVQMAEFMPFSQPQLQLPGDFVFRCLDLRIEYWRSYLNRNFVALQRAIREHLGPGSQDEQALYKTTEDTGTPLQQLHVLTDHAPDAVRREAAVRLVQVYTSYRPQAELSWLGPAAPQCGHADRFRWQVERRNDRAIPAAVAAALSELTALYRADVDLESVILEKIATHRLCLIDGRGRREAHWEAKLIDVDWERRGRAWTLLTAVAEDAHGSQQGVDKLSDLGISLRDARRDLKGLLPPELFSFLHVKKGVHRLALPRAEFYFGRFDSRDHLEEV